MKKYISPNQQDVLKFLSSVEKATKREIYKNVDFGYYHNWQKHFGAVLSRMVKSQMIFRESKGVYRIKPSQSQLLSQPQIGLFAVPIEVTDKSDGITS